MSKNRAGYGGRGRASGGSLVPPNKQREAILYIFCTNKGYTPLLVAGPVFFPHAANIELEAKSFLML